MELLSERPQTFTQIQTTLDLPKSTTWGLLTKMEKSGSVEKDIEGRYKLGNLILRLGLSMFNNLNVKNQAEPIMQKMTNETQEISHLCIYDRKRLDVVYIAKLEGEASIQIKTSVGSSNPCYCTASGKVLLAALKDNEIEHYIKKVALTRFTDHTITDPAQLKQELINIRQKGYAIDYGEHIEYSVGISAPVYDHQGNCIAALSVTGLADRMKEKKKSIITLVKQSADQLSRLMGYPM